MKPIQANCNTGCGQYFEITSMPTVPLGNGIEKTFFTCSHCGREYVTHYTDVEVRRLQEKLRKVQRRFASPNYDHKAAAKQEEKIKAQIKLRMDGLRERVEIR